MTDRPSLLKALEILRKRWPEARSASDAEPVFVFAAGWRSGSTLLQRLLMRNVWMWGEPFGHAWLVDSISSHLRCLTPEWPQADFFHRGQPAEKLKEKFIANLYPPVQALLDAHRRFFETLLAEPAAKLGATRWGLKEVRLEVEHAVYLQRLFPKAKFLFLHRNPYDAWRSYAARRDVGWKWFDRWPDLPLTAARYGARWRELVASFMQGPKLVGGLIVPYQELAAGEFGRLEAYLGFGLDRSLLKVNPTDFGPPPQESIAADALKVLQAEVEPLAMALGYAPTGSRKAPAAPSVGVAAVPPASAEAQLSVPPAAGPAAPAPKRETPPPPAPLPPVAPIVFTTEVGANLAAADAPAARIPPGKCVVLVPVGHHIEPDCDHSLRELERRGYEVRRVHGFAAIDQGRSQMATDALKAGFDELFWVDSDVAFHPDSVEQLRARPEPVVGGVYAKKGRRAFACNFRRGQKEVRFGRNGETVEVDHLGFGFVLTRRPIYEKMREQFQLPSCNKEFGDDMIPYFMPMTIEGENGARYLAEDYAFCERARRCGASILVDCSIRLWHVGKYSYGWEDAGSDVRRFPNYLFHIR